LKNLAIILARKNSKRLKGKNNLTLGGKSLIKRAIESSKKSKIYNKIIVSSDDPKILKLSKNFSDINFIKRKNSLAKDKIKAISVVLDIIKDYKLYTSVSLLLPTCPFRSSKDIQNAFKIFKKNYKNTVSVTDYDFPPEFALKKNGFFYSPIKNSPLLKNKTRSQEFVSSLRPNGAIYISLISSLLKNKNFYSKKMNIYKMSKIKSIDIDTKLDFDLAKLIFNKYEKK
jgi:CMP-N-acetylneuraminic acid synthetase